jgi:hypothetical protein
LSSRLSHPLASRQVHEIANCREAAALLNNTNFGDVNAVTPRTLRVCCSCLGGSLLLHHRLVLLELVCVGDLDARRSLNLTELELELLLLVEEIENCLAIRSHHIDFYTVYLDPHTDDILVLFLLVNRIERQKICDEALNGVVHCVGLTGASLTVGKNGTVIFVLQ